MQIVTYILLGFGAIAAVDRLIGCRLGLGQEFEKGLMMLGKLTLSMTGMLIMAPFISHLLQNIRIPGPFDLSILPASILANDMGGAHLAKELASDNSIGMFNALIVSSMMGCTVSFTLPYVLQSTDKKHHPDILTGILCGISTIPVGCLVSGLILRVPIVSLLIDLVPLVILAVIINIGLWCYKTVTIKIFAGLGFVIKVIVTVGLFTGIVRYLTGYTLIPYTDTLENATDVILNIACIMVGAFPLLSIAKKLLSPLLSKLGDKMGINSVSAFGFLSTVGTSVSTFETVDKMDKKGITLNSAFAVSAAFVFVDHLAFTMSFDASYVGAMIVGKLVSGVCAVIVANLLYKY